MRLIANRTLALSRFPEQRGRLAVADPDLMGSSVEETLRYDSPVQMMFRGSKQDVRVGDVDIPNGQFVLTMLGGANRDPDRFPDPDRFDVGRFRVAFGHGIHFCLGAHLARRKPQIAFEDHSSSRGFRSAHPRRRAQVPGGRNIAQPAVEVYPGPSTDPQHITATGRMARPFHVVGAGFDSYASKRYRLPSQKRSRTRQLERVRSEREISGRVV